MVHTLRGAVLDRVRLVGLPALLGGVGGALVALLVVAYTGSVLVADQKAFAVGALLFGLALMGWSGSIMAGPGFENLQHYLDLGTDWSAADSRRSMARVGGAGFGWMIGVAVTTRLVVLVG